MLKWEQERNVFLRKQKGETGSELLCKMDITEKLSGRKGRKDGERKDYRINISFIWSRKKRDYDSSHDFGHDLPELKYKCTPGFHVIFSLTRSLCHLRDNIMLSCSVVSDSLQPHGMQHHVPLPMFICVWGFSRQEYWSGLPCPPPGDHSFQGIESRYPTL